VLENFLLNRIGYIEIWIAKNAPYKAILEKFIEKVKHALKVICKSTVSLEDDTLMEKNILYWTETELISRLLHITIIVIIAEVNIICDTHSQYLMYTDLTTSRIFGINIWSKGEHDMFLNIVQPWQFNLSVGSKIYFILICF